MPDFVRYFARDGIEGILATVGAVNLLAFLDPTVQDPQATTHALAIGAAAALIAAARRNAGRFSAWLNAVLRTDPQA